MFEGGGAGCVRAFLRLRLYVLGRIAWAAGRQSGAIGGGGGRRKRRILEVGKFADGFLRNGGLAPDELERSAGLQVDERREKVLIYANSGEFLQIISTFWLALVQRSEIRDQGPEIRGRRSGKGIMRERQRRGARRILDEELRPFRRAIKDKNPTSGLLRAVRQALGIPVAEIAAKMGVNRSVVFEIEAGETRCTIELDSLRRVAGAMGFKMVYGIVPEDGKTLEELAEERLWEKVIGEKRGWRG